eukprot:399489-Pleurochrysis_carterae.AAC.2
MLDADLKSMANGAFTPKRRAASFAAQPACSPAEAILIAQFVARRDQSKRRQRVRSSASANMSMLLTTFWHPCINSGSPNGRNVHNDARNAHAARQHDSDGSHAYLTESEKHCLASEVQHYIGSLHLPGPAVLVVGPPVAPASRVHLDARLRDWHSGALLYSAQARGQVQGASGRIRRAAARILVPQVSTPSAKARIDGSEARPLPPKTQYRRRFFPFMPYLGRLARSASQAWLASRQLRRAFVRRSHFGVTYVYRTESCFRCAHAEEAFGGD